MRVSAVGLGTNQFGGKVGASQVADIERDLEKEVGPAVKHFGLGILPCFPLAGGFLTGKYEQGKPAPKGSRGESGEYVKRYMTPENYRILDGLTEFAGRHDRTMGDLAHAWLLARPEISSVISGATSVAHVKANAAAADRTLTPEQSDQVNALLSGQPAGN